MNIKAQALFDDTAITGARAFGGPDVTSSAMKTAIREWFNLFFMRVPEREEDPAQRIPCAIIGRLVKAFGFAEYDSSFNSVPAPGSKADWMNVARKAIDAVKLDALQWAMAWRRMFHKARAGRYGRACLSGGAPRLLQRSCTRAGRYYGYAAVRTEPHRGKILYAVGAPQRRTGAVISQFKTSCICQIPLRR